MKVMMRSWRLLILMWAVLLAPQVALVHGLSHGLASTAHDRREADKQPHVAAKVCDTCLAFAQLGAALPSRFEWIAGPDPLPDLAGAGGIPAESRHTGLFDARAPPALPI